MIFLCCLQWVLAFISHSKGKYRVEEQLWRIQHSCLSSVVSTRFMWLLQSWDCCECSGSARSWKRSWTDTCHMKWHPEWHDSNTCWLWNLSKNQGKWKPCLCVPGDVTGDEWKVSQSMAGGGLTSLPAQTTLWFCGVHGQETSTNMLGLPKTILQFLLACKSFIQQE